MKANMKNKRWLITSLVFLFIVVYSGTMSVSAMTATKDVTKKYKSSVANTLKGMDEYLNYTSGRSLKFRYDAYTKTTMACMKYGETRLNGKTESSVKKAVIPLLKRYFGTSTFKVRKYSENDIQKISSLYIHKKGNKIWYLQGQWGLKFPAGNISKIIQTNSNRLVATYVVNWYDRTGLYQPVKKLNRIGTYKIYLKKSGSKFLITNIKCVS